MSAAANANSTRLEMPREIHAARLGCASAGKGEWVSDDAGGMAADAGLEDAMSPGDRGPRWPSGSARSLHARPRCAEGVTERSARR